MNDLLLHTLAEHQLRAQQIVKTPAGDGEEGRGWLEQVFQKLEVKAEDVDRPAIDGQGSR